MTNTHDELADAFREKRIVVGVTGGVAAYKTCALVSRLSQAGAIVTPILTESAARFVSPLTFEALAASPVYTSMWERIEAHDPQHIAIARRASAMVVAPCTMNCLAQLAMGLASDVVTLVASAIDRARTPLLLAPAMNAVMWRQPATQRNIASLRDDGFAFIGPDEGWQACRTVGPGRMAEPDTILHALAGLLR